MREGKAFPEAVIPFYVAFGIVSVMRLPSISMAVMILAFSGGPSNSMSLPDEPYVQALKAVRNYSGCEFRPHADVGNVKHQFAHLEAEARAKGLNDYISAGQHAYGRWQANKLIIGCYPNEPEAKRAAELAMRHFRDYIHQIANIKR